MNTIKTPISQNQYDIIGTLSNLKKLSISELKISDLTFISKLHKLKHLSLSGGIPIIKDADASILSSLSELETLSLTYGQITNIDFVSELSKLRRLDVSQNKIKNVNPVINLKHLESLNVNYNSISDYELLEKSIKYCNYNYD